MSRTRTHLIIAKYEATEFLIGNILLVFGGLLLNSITMNEISFLGAAMIVIGGFLDYRVFNRSNLERRDYANHLKETTEELNGVLKKIEEQKKITDRATVQLQRTVEDMRKLKGEIEGTQKSAFSFMSKASRGKPIEDMITDVDKKQEKMFEMFDESLKNVERKLGISKYRRYPS